MAAGVPGSCVCPLLASVGGCLGLAVPSSGPASLETAVWTEMCDLCSRDLPEQPSYPQLSLVFMLSLKPEHLHGKLPRALDFRPTPMGTLQTAKRVAESVCELWFASHTAMVRDRSHMAGQRTHGSCYFYGQTHIFSHVCTESLVRERQAGILE